MKNSKTRIRKINILLMKAKAIFSWLSTVTNVPANDQVFIFRVAEKIFNVVHTRGLTSGVNYAKDLRTQFLNSIFSYKEGTLSPQELPESRFIRKYVRYIEKIGSYPHLRLTLSALNITRFLKTEPTPSFQSITERPVVDRLPHDIRKDIHYFLKDIGLNPRSFYKKPSRLEFREFHMTSKNGPNGHALWTSFYDAYCLSDNQRTAIKVVGGDRLDDLISRNLGLSSKIPQFFWSYTSLSKRSGMTRKLVAIPDKECKTREVAILDYWSQAALMPLHDYLYSLLSRISQDCTFDQTKWFDHLDSQNDFYDSIDLTTATDRFPILLQKEILTVLAGEEYASSWEYLMVGEPFIYEDKELTYACGNPMGAYSSFAIFALSHHFLVWKSCQLSHRKWRNARYMMLGDDIVIADSKISMHYKEQLQRYGIPYNPLKTHTSLVGFEFAKQIRINGFNVSPFPISGLVSQWKSEIISLSIILSEFSGKGWDVDLKSSLKAYLSQVKRWHEAKLRVSWPKYDLALSLILYLRGNGNLGKSLQTYVASLSPRSASLPFKAFEQLAQFVSNEVLNRSFEISKSRIVDSSNPKPLGLLAEQMVMAITSTRDGGMDCFDLIESVPFLQIYGRAEETWLKLQRSVPIFFGNIRPETWRSFFMKVDIPLEDEAFYSRNRDVLVVDAWNASKLIIKILNERPRVFDPPDRAFSDPQLGWYY